MNVRWVCGAFLLLCVPGVRKTSVSQPAKDSSAPAVLQPAQLEETLPATVFFESKVATTQARNSGGMRSAEGKITEFVMVDASGYSSEVRERYQFYLLTSSALEVAGKRLEAGAYGGGFLNGSALFMDLGGRELLKTPLLHDPDSKRPRPLQVLPEAAAGGQGRLALGRDYIVFRQVR